jgi:hypothetical protein
MPPQRPHNRGGINGWLMPHQPPPANHCQHHHEQRIVGTMETAQMGGH